MGADETTIQREAREQSSFNATRELFVVLLILGLALVYLPTTQRVLTAWLNQSGYSHGGLVLLIAVWLIARPAYAIPIAASTPSSWLFGLTFFASVIWIFGYVTPTEFVHMLALLAVPCCGNLSMFRGDSWRQFLLPVGILIFSVLLWDAVTPILQEMTNWVNSLFLASTGWTAFIVGDVVHVEAGSFRIAEGCAGTHFFVIALTISTIVAAIAGAGSETTRLLSSGSSLKSKI